MKEPFLKQYMSNEMITQETINWTKEKIII